MDIDGVRFGFGDDDLERRHARCIVPLRVETDVGVFDHCVPQPVCLDIRDRNLRPAVGGRAEIVPVRGNRRVIVADAIIGEIVVAG